MAAGTATGTAERVLELVRAREPAAEAEVTVRGGADALTRFANSFIHQNVAEELGHVSVRVAIGQRVAVASLDGWASGEALDRLVTGAIEAARVRPDDPDWPGVAPVAPAPDVAHWDDATAEATPEERAGRVAAFVQAARGLEAAGACSTEAVRTAFANSAGQRLTGRATVASLDGIARTSTSDGQAEATSVRLDAIDGRAVGELAVRKARAAAEPGDLEPGRYEVVLEPSCVADLLAFLFVYGLNGRALEEGRSFVRLGESQFDDAISVRDDATDPDQVGLLFDAEGTPKRRVDAVRRGVTEAVLHTRRTAARAGTQSTGHAAEGGEGIGAIPSNPVLEGGDSSLDELIASVERGILVTDFWYTRVLDPRTQVVTGLTRNGVWLLEDGRVVRPVRNLRFTQSYVEALAPGAVLGIGRERALIPGAYGSVHLVPALRLASWNFTGGALG